MFVWKYISRNKCSWIIKVSWGLDKNCRFFTNDQLLKVSHFLWFRLYIRHRLKKIKQCKSLQFICLLCLKYLTRMILINNSLCTKLRTIGEQIRQASSYSSTNYALIKLWPKKNTYRLFLHLSFPWYTLNISTDRTRFTLNSWLFCGLILLGIWTRDNTYRPHLTLD